MKAVLEIANVVLPVFMLIGLGFALRLRGFLTPTISDSLSRLVFYAAAPALIFRSIVHTTLSAPVPAETLRLVLGGSLLLSFLLIVIGTTIVISLAVSFLTYIATAPLAPSARGVVAQGVYRSNMVFVGLPLLMNAYGSDILGPVAVFISFMTPVYNVMAVILLALPFAKKETLGRSWRKAAREIAINPLIISCLLGLLFSAFSLHLPSALDTSLKLLGELAMPLALLVVGASLDLQPLRSHPALPFLVSLIKLIIYPALIFISLFLLGVSGLTLTSVTLLMASPNAVVSHIMAKEMGGDEQLAGTIVIMTTLFSLLTLSGWLALFKILPL